MGDNTNVIDFLHQERSRLVELIDEAKKAKQQIGLIDRMLVSYENGHGDLDPISDEQEVETTYEAGDVEQFVCWQRGCKAGPFRSQGGLSIHLSRKHGIKGKSR